MLAQQLCTAQVTKSLLQLSIVIGANRADELVSELPADRGS